MFNTTLLKTIFNTTLVYGSLVCLPFLFFLLDFFLHMPDNILLLSIMYKDDLNDVFCFMRVFLLPFDGSDGNEYAYNAGDLGLIPGSEDPLEKEMATHCNILT